jgi:hypothetical protein
MLRGMSVASSYASLTRLAKGGLLTPHLSSGLRDLIGESLSVIGGRPREALTSNVPGKSYCVLRHGAVMTRPINTGLFDPAFAASRLHDLTPMGLAAMQEADRKRLLYTAAMSYCAAADLATRGDQKTPGTFFEIFVGHLVASAFNCEPRQRLPVDILGFKTELPTDYVFDLGDDKSKIHLPIKTSTRERVIQVWAHQRVLDGVYGINRFRGVLTCLAETNMQRKTMSVGETCLPDQWVIYQMYIAQMHRIYYMDTPDRYARLGDRYPYIQVKPFASFFAEAERIATVAPAE